MKAIKRGDNLVMKVAKGASVGGVGGAIQKGIGMAKKLLGQSKPKPAVSIPQRSVQQDAMALDKRNQALSGVRRK